MSLYRTQSNMQLNIASKIMQRIYKKSKSKLPLIVVSYQNLLFLKNLHKSLSIIKEILPKLASEVLLA